MFANYENDDDLNYHINKILEATNSEHQTFRKKSDLSAN